MTSRLSHRFQILRGAGDKFHQPVVTLGLPGLMRLQQNAADLIAKPFGSGNDFHYGAAGIGLVV